MAIVPIDLQPVTDITRKKVSEIRRLKKTGFIEKPEKMLPECIWVAKERMLAQDSYLAFAKKQDLTRFSGAHLISIRSPVSI